jgi:hypothetical protein
MSITFWGNTYAVKETNPNGYLVIDPSKQSVWGNTWLISWERVELAADCGEFFDNTTLAA